MKMPARITALAVVLLFTANLVHSQTKVPTDISGDVESIRKEFGLPGIAAAVVLTDGTIVKAVAGARIAGKSDAVTFEDNFHLGSVGKSMTATMIATLVEDGELRWNTTVADVFKVIGAKIHPSLRAVTLEQLLSHRGGIPPFEDEKESVWLALPKLKGTSTEVRYAFTEWILARGAASPVGEHLYSNAGYCIAAAMAERVTGQSWETLMKERLFKRADLKSGGHGWPANGRADQPWGHREKDGVFEPHAPNDDYQLEPFIDPAGDIYLNIGDYAKYALLHLRGLRGKPAVLKAETFKKLHEPIGDYALGWNRQMVRDLPASTHSGSAGTFYAGIMVYFEKDIAIVIQINASGGKVNTARNKLYGVLLKKFGAIS